jgi:hypothetical protein
MYYNDNTEVLLNYGFDYNPLEDTGYVNLYIEFFDVVNKCSVIWECKNRDNLSGNFMEIIPVVDTFGGRDELSTDYRVQFKTTR